MLCLFFVVSIRIYWAFGFNFLSFGIWVCCIFRNIQLKCCSWLLKEYWSIILTKVLLYWCPGLCGLDWMCVCVVRVCAESRIECLIGRWSWLYKWLLGAWNLSGLVLLGYMRASHQIIKPLCSMLYYKMIAVLMSQADTSIGLRLLTEMFCKNIW